MNNIWRGDLLDFNIEELFLVEKIDTNFLLVGMGNIHISSEPIATNSIATCMVVAMHINDTNYMSHMSPWEYSNTNPTTIDKWKLILKENLDIIKNNYIYIYTSFGMICKDSYPFFNMLKELELLNNVIVCSSHVLNPFNTDDKIIISSYGLYGYSSECN